MFIVLASVIIQFTAFTGEGCTYDPLDAGFFIDRWSESLNAGDIPYEKLWGREIDRRAFNLPLAEIPPANSSWVMYFRFFAKHSATSSDQYESDFRLTREWVNSLNHGEVYTESLKMNPTYEIEQGRQCLLTVRFVKL